MSSSTSESGYVRAGSFCTLGDSGSTEAGTPMRCTETGDGKRARWRKAAGAVSASRVRKRESRTPRECAADKLRQSELNYLRKAAGLPYEGALPRNKSQKTKLETAGFTDSDGNITDAGREALRRRDALDDKPAASAEDRSAAGDTDWSRYLACATCPARRGEACHDLSTIGALNAHPHPGRPTVAAPADPPSAPTTAPRSTVDTDAIAAARRRQERIDTARAAAKAAAADDEARFDEGHSAISSHWDQAEKSGAARVGNAGDVEAFDPVRHDVLGERPAPGDDVTILRPGSQWTGDDPVTLEKPLVVAGHVSQPEDRSADASTDWTRYDACHGCSAGPAEPCYDLSGTVAFDSYNAFPHDGRPTVGKPLEGQPMHLLRFRNTDDDPAPTAEEARNAYERAASLNAAELAALPDDVVNAAVHHPSRSYSRDMIVDEAVRRATPVDPNANVVDGHHSTAPELPNGWGLGQGDEVSFHDHGATGHGLQEMGSDRFMDVDGEPIVNHAGRIATRVVRRQVTPQQGADEMRKLRDRTPEGSGARRGMDSIVEAMGCPQTPPPAVPAAVPEPVRRLARDLHEQFPIVRRDGRETGKLVEICNDWMSGDRRTAGLGLGQRLNHEVAGAHHESDGDRGRIAIDARVAQCVRELEELRKSDRTALYPPRW